MTFPNCKLKNCASSIVFKLILRYYSRVTHFVSEKSFILAARTLATVRRASHHEIAAQFIR